MSLFPFISANIIQKLVINYANSLVLAFYLKSTVFPRIVSAETILFWSWPYVLWPLMTVHKSVETIQGRKLFAEIRYIYILEYSSNKSTAFLKMLLLIGTKDFIFFKQLKKNELIHKYDNGDISKINLLNCENTFQIY